MKNVLLVIGMLALGASLYFRLTQPPPLKRQPSDAVIERAQKKLAQLPHVPELHAELAIAYMRKAREVGDPAFYKRAEVAVNRALELKPDHYTAVKVMSWVLAGQHRFDEALPWAQRAANMQPNDPFNYGTMGDAYLESGYYDEAAEAFQKMVNLRPGINSYSRAAQLRELFGDREGAIEIMKMAVKAASPRDSENLAWAQVRLGQMYFRQDDLANAEAQFQAALTTHADYYLALAALAKVRPQPEAITLMEKVVALSPIPHYLVELGDLYAAAGRQQDAARLFERFEQICLEADGEFDHELAIYYADHGKNLDRAIEIMRRDLEKNKDIGAYDTLAWALYKAGRREEARAAIRQAMRLGTQDPQILRHAQAILKS
jgi:tetratricopeptide (TPR) repeat protein